MPAALTTPSANAPRTDLQELAREIQHSNRSLLRDLRIEHVDGGVALHGVAFSFYGKQIAQHEILRRGNVTIVTNRIVVLSRR
jgi:hypothetical protein